MGVELCGATACFTFSSHRGLECCRSPYEHAEIDVVPNVNPAWAAGILLLILSGYLMHVKCLNTPFPIKPVHME